MFDDSSERTLPPTERRRREAKERGQVARSPELTAAAILLASGFTLQFLAASAAGIFADLMRSTISNVSTNTVSLGGWSRLFGPIFFSVLGPILGIALLFGLLANLVQTGWIWAPATITPRIRTSTGRWGERVVWSLGRILLLCAMSFVLWRFLLTHQWQLRSLAAAPATSMLVEPSRLIGQLCVQLAICLTIFALIDYGVRYWRNEQRLKMTVDEVRQEQREAEGKGKRQRQTTNESVSEALPIGNRNLDPANPPKG